MARRGGSTRASRKGSGCPSGVPGDFVHAPARPGFVARSRAPGGRLSGVRIAARRAAACSCGFRGARRPEVEYLETLQLLSGAVAGTAPLVDLSPASDSAPISTSPPAATLVQDLVPGPKGSFPQSFVDANGTVFFLAFDQNSFFDKLWASDRIRPGTRELDPNLEANPPVALGSSGSVAFTAFDLNTSSFGIWVSDGTTAGTQELAALPTSSTDAVAELGNTAFFEIYDFQTHQEELWKSDGTPSGTGFVVPIRSPRSSRARGASCSSSRTMGRTTTIRSGPATARRRARAWSPTSTAGRAARVLPN